MDKGGHNDVEMKGWMQKRGIMCKLKGWIYKDRHYDMRNQRVDGKGGIMMCKLKGRMDKGGHYDVEMKGWMQKGGHYYVQIKGGDG